MPPIWDFRGASPQQELFGGVLHPWHFSRSKKMKIKFLQALIGCAGKPLVPRCRRTSKFEATTSVNWDIKQNVKGNHHQGCWWKTIIIMVDGWRWSWWLLVEDDLDGHHLDGWWHQDGLDDWWHQDDHGCWLKIIMMAPMIMMAPRWSWWFPLMAPRKWWWFPT